MRKTREEEEKEDEDDPDMDDTDDSDECPECGAEMDEDDDHCPECGYSEKEADKKHKERQETKKALPSRNKGAGSMARENEEQDQTYNIIDLDDSGLVKVIEETVEKVVSKAFSGLEDTIKKAVQAHIEPISKALETQQTTLEDQKTELKKSFDLLDEWSKGSGTARPTGTKEVPATDGGTVLKKAAGSVDTETLDGGTPPALDTKAATTTLKKAFDLKVQGKPIDFDMKEWDRALGGRFPTPERLDNLNEQIRKYAS